MFLMKFLLIIAWFISCSDCFFAKRQEKFTTTPIITGTPTPTMGSQVNYSALGQQKELIADSTGKIVIKIGHIGAMGFLPNDDKIINISRAQLIEEGLLGKEIDFE